MTNKPNNVIPIYIPLALAYALSALPIFSFLTAWLGSFVVFYFTWITADMQKDQSILKHLMRPLFLLQVIFAGLMCCTSIFYFLDHLGYQYLSRLNASFFHDHHQTSLIAQCQRLALLAHVGLAHGLMLKTQPQKATPSYRLNTSTDFLIGFSISCYALGFAIQQISGLSQLGLMLSALAISGGTLLFVKGLINKNTKFLIIGAVIFATNFAAATLSGFKEPIIVNVLLLGILLFPHYKKAVLWLGIPIFYVLFYILPTFTSTVRKSWSGETTATEARAEAINLLQEEDNQEEIYQTNWDFLTNRLSEINMFTQYVDYVPAQHPYYGWEIVNNSITALIPRVFWPNKPITETVAMERVYDAGVINRLSDASAKTRPIVDAYLSWGIVGVYIFMLLYGMLAQWLNNQCEQLFGGYEFGCIVIFNGLFQIMWRGNNFEFMFTNILYGALLMFILFFVLKRIGILQKI